MWINKCLDHSPHYIWISEVEPTVCVDCGGSNIVKEQE